MNEEKIDIEAIKSKINIDAIVRANAKLGNSKKKTSSGFFGGNLGDSIEKRFTGHSDMLGGGSDLYQGVLGPSQTYLSAGGGNYFGAGIFSGVGRMFSGVHSFGIGGVQRFSSNSKMIHGMIAQCMMAYVNYGIVKHVVDLYADFSCEGVEIYHPDKTIQQFYTIWAEKIQLKQAAYSWFINMFSCGNVFTHRKWAQLTPNEERTMKRASSAEILNNQLIVSSEDKDQAINANIVEIEDDKNQTKTKRRRIPWEYTFLNPLQMEPRGSKFKNENHWVMCLSKTDIEGLTNKKYDSGQINLNQTKQNLPKEFKNKLKKYKGHSPFVAEIELSDAELAVVQAPNKYDWFDWGIPFCYPALKNLYYKDCLRTMELKVCESIINTVVLYKLGDVRKGLAPEDEAFERLADMLQVPGASLNIIWNDLIDAQVIQPNVGDIFDIKKHDSADRDIVVSLGVPEVLVGGKGGNFSNSYLAVAVVLEKLETYREKFISWLRGEMKLVADAMGFRKIPEVKFKNTSLRDESAYNTFLLALYDRNVISADTLLEPANTSVKEEVAKLTNEKGLRKKDILEPRGPFIKNENEQTNINGRPKNSQTGPTGKQSNPRGPKGQGLASVMDGLTLLETIRQFLNTNFIKIKAQHDINFTNISQADEEEQKVLEGLIYNIFSHFSSLPKDNRNVHDLILNILNSDQVKSMNELVFEDYQSKIDSFRLKTDVNLTQTIKDNFLVSSWLNNILE